MTGLGHRGEQTGVGRGALVPTPSWRRRMREALLRMTVGLVLIPLTVCGVYEVVGN